ncbi:phosphotransferase [Alicyclobacillus macrosporangiidus]|uniref:phosphotransferase n=1 Tax=Alicyclobacillus macrosporangiidus TaxID=392015 RepID=UPI0034E96165
MARCHMEQNRIGHSGSMVFRLTGPDRHVMYLKIRAISEADCLRKNTDWSGCRGCCLYRKSWVSKQTTGMSSSSCQKSGESLFPPQPKARYPGPHGTVASGLRMIHQLDRDRCPFYAPLHEKLEAVRNWVRNGGVEEYLPYPQPNPMPPQLVEELAARVPTSDDLVVCHGDYSMPNVILQDGRISGFIDLGQVGVADRYVDLIAMRKTLRYNGFPDECFARFIKAYGLDRVDDEKLRFYELLDDAAWGCG